MKRGASDSGAGTSPGHPAKVFKGSSDQGKGSEDNGEFPDEKTLLRSQNRRLAEEMRRRQRQEAELEKQLAKAWAKQGHFDATISIVKRAWDQVLVDLSTAASGLGLGPRPLYVKAEKGAMKLCIENGETVKVEEEEEEEEEEEGEVEKTGSKSTRTGATSSGDASKVRTELFVMEKLLMPAAKVLAMDATDSAAGDGLVKEKAHEESRGGSNRSLLSGMAGTSSAFYDLDSEGFGLSSRENIKDLVQSSELEAAELERVLDEKARYTAELAGRLFQAMHAHLTSLPEESRKAKLHAAHLDLVSEKRMLVAEKGFVTHQLLKAKARCLELSEAITAIREDLRKANRTLDKLAEDGIDVHFPSDGERSGAKGSSVAGGLGGIYSLHGASGKSGGFSRAEGLLKNPNGRQDPLEMMAALQEVQGLADSRKEECERLRAGKIEVEREVTRLKAATQLDPSKSNLSGHPQYQRLSSQLEAEQDMLKLEKARVAEMEEQLEQMSQQLQQHETALEQQMEQQRLRWKSEMHSSNTMLNTAHEELDKTQGKLRQEQRVGSNILQSACLQRDEMSRLLHQTEQQVSILKKSLERANKAREHAEAQSSKDRARLDRYLSSSSSSTSREEESLRARLADSARELSGSKAVEDALQSELNTTLAAYAESKEGNQKLIQEISRIMQSHKELSEEVTLAKAQLKNRHQVRQTMELQIKTAAQMRDQGHALKQKALDLVNEAERKIQQERNQRLDLSREVHKEKAHADRARQDVDALTQMKQAIETSHRELKEHCQRLNSKIWAMEEDLDRSKEQHATLTRKVEKQRAQFQRLVSATEESNQKDSADEDLREEELAELRKMIKCSVCQDRKKNRVITKCYHMFCDQCVSLNLKTRNRKCPACAKPFGQDDVHELWLT